MSRGARSASSSTPSFKLQRWACCCFCPQNHPEKLNVEPVDKLLNDLTQPRELTEEDLQLLLTYIEEAIDGSTASNNSSTLSDTAQSTINAMPGFMERVLQEFTTANNQVNTAFSEAMSQSVHKLLLDVLNGLGSLHWIGLALSMVAYLLKQRATASGNRRECVDLFQEIKRLLVALVHLHSKFRNDTEANIESIRSATCIIAGGTIACFHIISESPSSRFFKAIPNSETLKQFREEIKKIYTHLTFLVGIKNLDLASPKYSSETPRGTFENKVGLEERVQAVLQIIDSLKNGPSACVVILHGMGGIGKSTLLQAVTETLQSQRQHTFCHIQVNESPSIPNLQEQIYQCLIGETCRIQNDDDGRAKLARGLDELKKKKTRSGGRDQMKKRMSGDLKLEQQPPVLLSIDNVWKAKHVEDLLPDAFGSCLPKGSVILITSRNARVGDELTNKSIDDAYIKHYSVKNLPQQESRQLLINSLGPMFDRVAGGAMIDKLLGACDGHPLALTLAGKYIRHTKGNPARACETVIDSLRDMKSFDGSKEDGLVHRLGFSVDQLDDELQNAFFDICSFFNLAKDFDGMEVEQIFGEGCLSALSERFSLVTTAADSFKPVQVHDLLVALGRKRMPKHTRITSWEELQPLLNDEQKLKEIEGLDLRKERYGSLREKLPSDAIGKMHRLRLLFLPWPQNDDTDDEEDWTCSIAPDAPLRLLYSYRFSTQMEFTSGHLVYLRLKAPRMDLSNLLGTGKLTSLRVLKLHISLV